MYKLWNLKSWCSLDISNEPYHCLSRNSSLIPLFRAPTSNAPCTVTSGNSFLCFTWAISIWLHMNSMYCCRPFSSSLMTLRMHMLEHCKCSESISFSNFRSNSQGIWWNGNLYMKVQHVIPKWPYIVLYSNFKTVVFLSWFTLYAEKWAEVQKHQKNGLLIIIDVWAPISACKISM